MTTFDLPSQFPFVRGLALVLSVSCLLGAGCLGSASIGEFMTIGTAAGSGSSTGSSSGTGGTTVGSSTGTASGGTTGGLLSAGLACLENAACRSGVCGVAGTGHCCVVACSPITGPCGATDCDDGGACAFPDDAVACGQPPFCTGSRLTNPNVCDGAGNCRGAVDCAPFACAASGCLTGCLDNSGCATGSFCDTASFACCPTLSSGGTIRADSVAGNDGTACCGAGGSGACQTLGRAMQLISSAHAEAMTIVATVEDGGGDWSPPGETYPIVLGWGVELSAPGVYFLNRNGGDAEAFAIAAYSADDATGYASVVGTNDNHVGVGLNRANTLQTAASGIEIEAAHALYIANATVNAGYGDDAVHSHAEGGSFSARINPER